MSRNGLVLRCKLLEQSNPLVPTLRLRISTRYPDEPPEILSLTNSTPPKLEFSGNLELKIKCKLLIDLDGHPFFEQLSTIFVSYLFKLPFQHTVTDILNIWVEFSLLKILIFNYSIYFSIDPSNLPCKKTRLFSFESITM